MKKHLVKNSLCLLLALALCFGEFTPILRRTDITASAAATVSSEQTEPLAAQSEPEQTEGVVRPEDIDEGLSLNSLDDIRGRRVTVRQPVMQILRDDIARKPADVLPNEYEMRNLQTGEIMHSLAKIDFASDKKLEAGNKDHPMYPMKGLDRSPKDENGNVTKQLYFSEFTKYMLLRQAYYFNTHVSEIIKNDELKKHPAADYIYGKIPDEAKAVQMRIVTDPIYRSPITTGLYLVPGEVATVKIKGLKAGETVTLYTHHQDTLGYLGYNAEGKGFGKMEDYLAYWDEKIVNEAKHAEETHTKPDFDRFSYGLHGQWVWQNQKVPCMGTTFNIVGTGEETVVKIGSMYGGPLYVKPTSDSVDMEITGAVLTPHFVLGVTTVEEFDRQLREAPGLIATLDVENGQLIGPAEDMKNCDDIEKLAYFWHSVFAIDISLNGRDYNYNMTMCYDLHVPAGEAVALNSNFCAQPAYWFPVCMNYETLTTKGNWGTFHELGHVQAKTHGVNWGFCDGDGEVWNNTLILLIYSMLCNMDSRVIGVEHGEYVHPFTAVERSQKITRVYKDKATGETHTIEDYGEINEGGGAHFDQLSMYATLLHSFGPEKFVDMFYTYKMNSAYCPNKRADFVYRIGIVDRVNILDWVNENYFANIEDNMFTEGQLAFLRSLPIFVPVAYRWANGIDGHETARKYDVDGKSKTVFDLGGNNISSPKKVEILAVTGVRNGQIDYDPDTKKVTYTPPIAVTEYDSFDIIVKTEGGRRVTLNVNMRLVYRGMYAEVWDLGPKADWKGQSPTVAAAQEAIKDKPFDYTLTSPAAGVEFTHDNMEYLHLKLKYRAPKGGDYRFYIKADDYAVAKFYKSELGGESLGTINVTHDTTNFKQYGKVDANLKAKETVYIDCYLVNWGGKGHITVGVHMPGAPEDEIVALPAEDILSAGVKDSELPIIDKFEGWQPRFVDSIKNTTIDYQTSNSGWQVLVEPESEKGSDGKNLVDGNEGTIFHSKYNGYKASLPHVFVIDTLKDQTFNYFEFVRRTNGNDKLVKFSLYACTSDEYKSAATDEKPDGWRELFNGASSNVNAARQRISFQRMDVRYFKFVVTDNNGGHTVLKEIYAGTESKLNQTVKPSNYKTGSTNFEENSANGKLTATAKDATFTFKFLGSGFELYADTDPSYGKASVTIDQAYRGEIDLRDKPLFNKQVFLSGELVTGVHEVVVTTLDENPFNISFINVQYGTPVAAAEYPAMKNDRGEEDYGNTAVERSFTREWKTFVKDYKTLTSIKFLQNAPSDYTDTYVRIDTYIRLYRDKNRIAFVYPGKILAPAECGSLFAGCEKLTELVFENFDTTYIRGVTSMFYGCGSLEHLDVSAFKTENVLSFSKMFGNCTSLETVDLGNFELDGNASLYRMFDNCTGLATIKLPETVEEVKTRAATATTTAADRLTCELPYVYRDENTGKYVTELVLDGNMAGHTLTLHTSHSFAHVHTQVEPSCENTGTIAYKTCSTCRCNFDEKTGMTLLKDGDLVIPALGHSFTYELPPLDGYPTCTKPGIECRHYCKICNIDCPDDGGKVAMPAIGHSYMLDPAKGNGKGYTVEFRRVEVIEKTEMIDENGESYYTQEEVVVKGIAKVTFYLICQGIADWDTWEVCNHTTEVVFEFECDTHTDPTCTDAETFFFDFSVDEDMVVQAMAEQDEEDDIEDGLYANGFSAVTVSEVVEGNEAEGGAEALGHTYEKVEAVPATCLAHGSTAGLMCTVCGHTEGVTSTAPVGHDMKYQPGVSPTCTEAGHAAGDVCTRCGALGEGVTRLEPLDHDFSVEIAAEAPTCTKVGHTAGKKCSRCEAVEGCELIDDLGHEEEVMPGKDPTKTESGLTEGLRCHRCGEILKEQEEIPALGGKSGVGLWIGVGVAGVAAVCVCIGIAVACTKKKRKS